jgi:hypothetical protein
MRTLQCDMPGEVDPKAAESYANKNSMGFMLTRYDNAMRDTYALVRSHDHSAVLSSNCTWYSEVLQLVFAPHLLFTALHLMLGALHTTALRATPQLHYQFSAMRCMLILVSTVDLLCVHTSTNVVLSQERMLTKYLKM